LTNMWNTLVECHHTVRKSESVHSREVISPTQAGLP
jgi:hypothetical protein